MLLLNPLDGMRPPQPLHRLTAPLCVVIVVVLETSDLVLELFADLNGHAVSADLGGEGDIPDVGEGVVNDLRLGIVSVQVL